tara:strand:+ start:58903 stop:59829 length:927 start_codon:yes stop_codon:yes gene_type:complete
MKVGKKEKILITGGSGNLAKVLKKRLEKSGYNVVFLTTNYNKSEKSYYYWNITKKIIDPKALYECDHIVHLAGFNIMNRWTKSNKKKMYNSRVSGSKLIFEKCKENKINIKTFISASAIGYYGHSKKEIQHESNPPSNEWISKLAVDWEEAAKNFERINSRTICMRISLLIDKNSGYLKSLLLSMRLGIGAIFGNKKNIIEWIHIEDAARFIAFSIKNKKIKGAYNLSTENKISQKDFIYNIKKKYIPYSIIIKIPNIILKIIFGQRKSIIEGGLVISTQKLRKSGFEYKYPNIELALHKELFNKDLN